MTTSITFPNSQRTIVLVRRPNTLEVRTAVAGPRGIQGPPGDDATDLRYVHDQMSASATWTIAHNLGKYPSVTVMDSGGSVCEGTIVYDSINQITLTFSAAFAGIAYLN